MGTAERITGANHPFGVIDGNGLERHLWVKQRFCAANCSWRLARSNGGTGQREFDEAWKNADSKLTLADF